MKEASKTERFKRKVSLAFPVEREASVRVEKRDVDGHLMYRATSNLLGCSVEEGWCDSRDLALDKCLKTSSLLVDNIYKMINFKFHLNMRKKKTKQEVEKKIEKNKKRTSLSKEESVPTTNNRNQRLRKQIKTVNTAPTFTENKKETKNNFVYTMTSVVDNPGEFIETYCRGKTIPFPEYLIEKSNGVYLCKATFLNERFESRYAFDMETAKKDASNLIITFIKYEINNSNDVEYKKLLEKFFNEEKNGEKEDLKKNEKKEDSKKNGEKEDSKKNGEKEDSKKNGEKEDSKKNGEKEVKYNRLKTDEILDIIMAKNVPKERETNNLPEERETNIVPKERETNNVPEERETNIVPEERETNNVSGLVLLDIPVLSEDMKESAAFTDLIDSFGNMKNDIILQEINSAFIEKGMPMNDVDLSIDDIIGDGLVDEGEIEDIVNSFREMHDGEDFSFGFEM